MGLANDLQIAILLHFVNPREAIGSTSCSGADVGLKTSLSLTDGIVVTVHLSLMGSAEAEQISALSP